MGNFINDFFSEAPAWYLITIKKSYKYLRSTSRSYSLRESTDQCETVDLG